jgi:hypothetical protein
MCQMKRTLPVVGVFLMAAIFLWAQRSGPYSVTSPVPGYAPLEVRSVFPREISPGKYEQVREAELQSLAMQGWELVSVMPYIYRNEERGPELQGPKPVVTQTYPAYFFKRIRVGGLRE